MPSSITHQLLSEEILPLLPSFPRDCAKKHTDYYFAGAQGPDLFFFLNPLAGKAHNLGRYLHRNAVHFTFRYFQDYLAAANGKEREILAAYFAGYLSHYAADRVFHPALYQYLGEHGGGAPLHRETESAWDTHFARQLRGRRAEGWSFPFSARKLACDGVLYALYHSLLARLGRTPPSERSFCAGLKRAERYLRAFHKKSRREGLRRAEKILLLPPLLSSCYPPKEADEEYVRGMKADELFEEAKADAVTLCSAFFSFRPLSPTLFSRDYLTGE